MNHISKIEKVVLFRTLFRGREDVFAIYWQKGKKQGYMPAYQYDPYMYRLHVYKGGTFNDYKDKTLLPLTDLQIIKHLKGERKHFLENHPENFSRIIHDYSEERKGFVIWKDMLEERLA